MRIRRLVFYSVVSMILLAVAGCTELVPGMNVSVGGPGQHSYQGSSGSSRQEAGQKPPSYQVIPITPQVVTDILTHPEPAISGPAGDPLKPLLPGAVPPEYRIGPGDLLNITVWDHPELNSPAGVQAQNPAFDGQLVAADGTIYYPFVGTFKASGMTVRQVREYLADHLQRVIQQPQVAVRVVRYDAQRVEITGEVAHPGTVTLSNTPKGVLQAIDQAGGLTPTASRRRAILVRHGVRYQIDLAGLLSGSRVVPNPELEPGDVIHVPDQSADQVFMLGAVAKQQPLVMTQDSITLMQALTDSGGLSTTRANGAGVLIFRLLNQNPGSQSPEPGPEADVYTLDMSKPEGVLLASQFPLQPRDVVYVKATAFAQYNSIIGQLLPTITSVFEVRQLTK